MSELVGGCVSATRTGCCAGEYAGYIMWVCECVGMWVEMRKGMGVGVGEGVKCVVLA